MEHGSKFVYVGGESSDDEVSDSELEKGVFNVLKDTDADEGGASLFDEARPSSPRGNQSGSGLISGWFSSIKNNINRSRSSAPSSSSSSTSTTTSAHSKARSEKEEAESGESNKNNNKKKKKVKKAKTNVVSVVLGTLASDATQISTGDPLFCRNCNAGFNIHSKLTEGENHDDTEPSKVWKCEFCDEINKDINLAPEEMPSAESMDYLIEPAPETANSVDESAVIFCLDISGSMCVTTEVEGKLTLKGDHTKHLASLNTERASQRLPNERRNVTYVSRLQSVQAAVDAAMNKLMADSPKKKVGLVTFNNEVNLIGDGSSMEPKIITGDKLSNYEELLAAGDANAIAKPIKDSRDKLHNKLYSLEEHGATALGPAILVSVSLATLKPGSQVIVCTDGKANVGLGALDQVVSDDDVTTVDGWYSQVGHYAASKGVCISVISIKGDDCRLEYLGKLAELTGGNVEIVNPLEITSQFSNILSKPIVATNTRCTVRLHKGLRIANSNESEREKSSSNNDNVLVRDIGNIVSDTEFTFEYSVNKSEASGITALPFQVQIEYQRPNGAKLMRLITQVQQTTSIRTQAEEEANVAVLATHVAQKSAQLAQEGEYGEARRLNVTHAKMFKRAATTPAKQKIAMNWANAAQELYEDISSAVTSEQQRGDNYSDDEDDANSDDESRQRRSAMKKKKSSNRKRERNDEYSNNVYKMKSASSTWWSK
eukprot:TRINITY_DN6891_c0_g1_i2.p1 TRINITY_DN6891_c0_g1~~TRINITY_DN6891_c0_g1_i2.p1  ORF type:complete len:715 (+),score=225.83 TRINITY_DN6891_c0_g1_i2:79-2223(+)